MDIYDASSAGMGPSSSPARLSYVSEKHPRHTLEAVNVLRKHRELCDVVLIVGQRRIFGHRVVLSACSPYFHAMFTGELVESRQMEVTEHLYAFEIILLVSCLLPVTNNKQQICTVVCYYLHMSTVCYMHLLSLVFCLYSVCVLCVFYYYRLLSEINLDDDDDDLNTLRSLVYLEIFKHSVSVS